jgi:hypothetical protein
LRQSFHNRKGRAGARSDR